MVLVVQPETYQKRGALRAPFEGLSLGPGAPTNHYPGLTVGPHMNDYDYDVLAPYQLGNG